MIAAPLLSTMLLLAGQAKQAEPPPVTPLSDEQTVQLRALIHSTQTSAATLQAQLDEKQRELARLYTEYDLKVRQVRRLEDEIVDLQKQLLANHHRLQVEMRSIVGRERFETLRQRVGRLIPTPGTKEPEPPRPK